MGSAAWIGIKGSNRQAVLDSFGLLDTGRDDPKNETRVSLAELPSGWMILFTRDDRHLSPQYLSVLSAGGLAFSCNLSTVSMFSEAQGYADGKPVWSVAHDCENGIYHLAVTGEPPAELAKIKAEATRGQDEDGGEESDTDFIFEVPIELTKALSGYRYDEIPDDGSWPFTALEPTGKMTDGPSAGVPRANSAPREGGLFSRLFKKR